MIFDTLQYVDGTGTPQEIALSLANVAGVPANNRIKFTPRSHAPSEFLISWAQPPETGVAIPFKSRCVVWAGRSSSAGAPNTFTGGTMIFQGRRWDNAGSASATGVSVSITLLDAYKDLQMITYAVNWNFISGGSIAAPTFATFAYQDVSLFQADSNITYNPVPIHATISTWQQIQDIIRYAAGFASGANAVQLQLAGSGTLTGAVWSAGSGAEFVPGYCNWYGVRSASCAECLNYTLRPHPAVFTEIDYSTTPPTLHLRNRAAMTAVTLPYKSTDINGVIHIATDIKSLDELVPDAVRLWYKITGSFNGQPVINFGSDTYPTSANSLICLDYPIDITGAVQTETIYNFVSTPFDPTQLALWRKKVNSLKQIVEGGQIPNDGSTGALAILDTTINGTVATHPDGLQVVDEASPPNPLSLATYLYYTDQDVFNWMTLPGGSAVSVAAANVTGFFSYYKNTGGALNLTPQVGRHSHSMRLKLTNAPSGQYWMKQTVNVGESVPPGLAQSLYTELSTLQWKLRHEIIQVAASASAVPTLIKPGKHRINLSGGNAAWTTMNAVPENVSIELFRVLVNLNDGSGKSEWRLAARHVINTGPVNHLEPGYLIQLWNLFVNRQRSGIDPHQRLSGGQSSTQVDLSNSSARENSVPANADFSVQPIYAPDAVNTGTSNVISHDATQGQTTVTQQPTAGGAAYTTGLIAPEYSGSGAPSATTLPANTYYRVGNRYVDTSVSPLNLYRCITTGTNSTSAWVQMGAGNPTIEQYNNAHSYAKGSIVFVFTATSVGGVGILPGVYAAITNVPGSGTGNQIPQFPLPGGTQYWYCISMGISTVNVCTSGGNQQIYINSSGAF